MSISDYFHKQRKNITNLKPLNVVYFTGDFACGLSNKVNRNSKTDLVSSVEAHFVSLLGGPEKAGSST